MQLRMHLWWIVIVRITIHESVRHDSYYPVLTGSVHVSSPSHTASRSCSYASYVMQRACVTINVKQSPSLAIALQVSTKCRVYQSENPSHQVWSSHSCPNVVLFHVGRVLQILNRKKVCSAAANPASTESDSNF